jgi:hypothetical protein
VRILRHGRALWRGPRPPERVDTLRAAVMAMVKDDAFAADVKKINFNIEPMSDDELQAYFAKSFHQVISPGHLILQVMSSYPADLIERAKVIASRQVPRIAKQRSRIPLLLA